jgi:catechol 2,3-dioxygenase-like lactoylglutathione lyase family enzyme
VTTSIGNVAILVADLERAERFYVDVLGLEVQNRISTPDVDEVIVGAATGGSSLVLARHRQLEAAPGGGPWKIFVHADDAAGLYERACASGAEAVSPPTHLEQFHVTIAFVRDPDGHLVELGQRHR